MVLAIIGLEAHLVAALAKVAGVVMALGEIPTTELVVGVDLGTTEVETLGAVMVAADQVDLAAVKVAKAIETEAETVAG